MSQATLASLLEEKPVGNNVYKKSRFKCQIEMNLINLRSVFN